MPTCRLDQVREAPDEFVYLEHLQLTYSCQYYPSNRRIPPVWGLFKLGAERPLRSFQAHRLHPSAYRTLSRNSVVCRGFIPRTSVRRSNTSLSNHPRCPPSQQQPKAQGRGLIEGSTEGYSCLRGSHTHDTYHSLPARPGGAGEWNFAYVKDNLVQQCSGEI